MDKYIQAYRLGQQQAAQEFSKTSSAADVARLLETLGSGAKETFKGLVGLGGSGVKGLKNIQEGGKYLGIKADPRKALLLGLGLAGASSIVPAAMELGAASPNLLHVLKEGAPGLVAGGAGLLAGAANPGILGGSATNRISHELAMTAATPAGLVGTMAGLVGLPAALIGYGKMKGKEESSLF